MFRPVVNSKRIDKKIWKQYARDGWKYDDERDVVSYCGVEFGNLTDYLMAPSWKILEFMKNVKGEWK